MPLSVPEVTSVLGDCGAPWWVGGGWAIDLLLGYESRSHGDVDVVILRRDQHVLRAHLAAWDLHAADPPGSLRPWPMGETLAEHVHDIWCRRTPADPWSFQFMIDDVQQDEWVFRRDHRIRRSVASLAGRASTTTRAVLTPEVQLLYKSGALRDKDEADFEVVLPHLLRSEREWLSQALLIASPDHPWLARLSA